MARIDSPEEQEQERLAAKQGEAYEASYEILMSEDPHAMVEADDYRITASFEPAEGMYGPGPDGSPAWDSIATTRSAGSATLAMSPSDSGPST